MLGDMIQRVQSVNDTTDRDNCNEMRDNIQVMSCVGEFVKVTILVLGREIHKEG